ncbi:MAG: TonB-dependent receptor [Flavobacteriales bacterium]|nr:TonB-dependent receptor [Bacteroidota bacterium]
MKVLTLPALDSNRVILSAKQKALRINLNQDLYGTFAEIGAGQEVVRHFFRAGGASGTIAKTISAYDKDFSDAIYGEEENSRYVCESRVKKMLVHEYALMENRLDRSEHGSKHFFAFANTVATINYHKTNQGHGWFGLKFQTSPDQAPNEVILHARLHESDALLQHQTVGMLGVNLIYGCFFFFKKPKELLQSLYDNLVRDQVEIDMVQMNGPDFETVDNRLLSLQLVKNGMTDAVIFSPDGRNLQAADVLYKKNILAIRGSFRPVTKVSIDMIAKGLQAFRKEARVKEEDIQVLFEITLNNLSAEGDIDEQDFLDRADVLCSIGQTVLISNYQKYYKLIDFFSRHTKKRMGVIMGANILSMVFDEKFYRDLHGGILEAFGILFSRDLKIYLYPWLDQESSNLWTVETTPVHPRMQPLFDYLKFNKRIVDIPYDKDVLGIFSKEALELIKSGDDGWEEMVPDFVDRIIKEKCLFGFCGVPTSKTENNKDDEDAAQAAARAISPDQHS